MSARWVAVPLAVAAVSLSVWTGVRLWRAPMRFEVVEATPDGVGANRRFESRRFSEVSGLGALPLAIPVLLAALGTWAAIRRRRVVLVSAAAALGLFTVVTGFSIGPAYRPAVCGLVLASIAAMFDRTRPPSGEIGEPLVKGGA